MMYGYVSDGMYSFDDFDFDQATKKWVLKTVTDENGNKKNVAPDCFGVLSKGGGYYGPGHMKLKDLNGDGVIDAGVLHDVGHLQHGGADAHST